MKSFIIYGEDTLIVSFNCTCGYKAVIEDNTKIGIVISSAVAVCPICHRIYQDVGGKKNWVASVGPWEPDGETPPPNREAFLAWANGKKVRLSRSAKGYYINELHAVSDDERLVEGYTSDDEPRTLIWKNHDWEEYQEQAAPAVESWEPDGETPPPSLEAFYAWAGGKKIKRAGSLSYLYVVVGAIQNGKLTYSCINCLGPKDGYDVTGSDLSWKHPDWEEYKPESVESREPEPDEPQPRILFGGQHPCSKCGRMVRNGIACECQQDWEPDGKTLPPTREAFMRWAEGRQVWAPAPGLVKGLRWHPSDPCLVVGMHNYSGVEIAIYWDSPYWHEGLPPAWKPGGKS